MIAVAAVVVMFVRTSGTSNTRNNHQHPYRSCSQMDVVWLDHGPWGLAGRLCMYVCKRIIHTAFTLEALHAPHTTAPLAQARVLAYATGSGIRVGAVVV